MRRTRLDLLLERLRGASALVMSAVSTVACSLPIYALAVAQLVFRSGGLRQRLDVAAIRCAEVWVGGNERILNITQTTRWDVRGVDNLDRNGRFLVSANHQSWADILVLQRVLNRRVPFLKFFLKRELIWMPVLGLAWKALGFPFMKRYSREYLAKHPDRAGKDMETTRRMCARFRTQPVSVINFLEGTRFSEDKHSKQGSPYRYLLQPKAGGVAFVLGAMGEMLDSLLDVTIVYVGERPTMWDFLCGRVDRIIVNVETREIPADLIGGDYMGDAEYRRRIQSWVAALWTDKDDLIGRLKAEF